MGRSRQEDVRIEHRRQQVAERYLKGQSQSMIARELSVSKATITADLKTIRQEWRESRIRDFNEAVDLELAKLEVLDREAWTGWERSLQPAETVRICQAGSEKHVEKTVRQQTGDPRYLEQVHRSILARRALLGLDAPTRIAPTGPDGQQAYHTHVMQELMRLAEQTAAGPVVMNAEFVERALAQATTENPLSEPSNGEESQP